MSHGAIQFVLYNEFKKKIGKKNLVSLELQSENPLNFRAAKSFKLKDFPIQKTLNCLR